jgi:hypothetical protein
MTTVGNAAHAVSKMQIMQANISFMSISIRCESFTECNKRRKAKERSRVGKYYIYYMKLRFALHRLSDVDYGTGNVLFIVGRVQIAVRGFIRLPVPLGKRVLHRMVLVARSPSLPY